MSLSRSDPLGPVHWIADLDVAGGPDELVVVARRLLPAGLRSVQLRGKGRTTDALVEAGRDLARLMAASGALFVVNGDAEAAVRLGAGGLHLPSSGPSPRDVRPTLPTGLLVGTSAHDADELERARGADWVLVSPVFPTRSKPDAPALGSGGLADLVRRSGPPVWGLGGVTNAEDVETCRKAGAVGVAAIRGLMNAGGEVLVRRAESAGPRPGAGRPHGG